MSRRCCRCMTRLRGAVVEFIAGILLLMGFGCPRREDE